MDADADRKCVHSTGLVINQESTLSTVVAKLVVLQKGLAPKSSALLVKLGL